MLIQDFRRGRAAPARLASAAALLIAVACSFTAPPDDELLANDSRNGLGGASGDTGTGGAGAGEPVNLCANDIKDIGETGTDCGGDPTPSDAADPRGCSRRCPLKEGCAIDGDCAVGVCVKNVCAEPACDDGKRNGLETDLDCGGRECAGCDEGQTCTVSGDCSSGVCKAGKCAAPTCSDLVKNGAETDVDCGSACATACEAGRTCTADDDCQATTCAPSTPAPVSVCAAGDMSCLCTGCPDTVNDCVTNQNCRHIFDCFLAAHCDSFEECMGTPENAGPCRDSVNSRGGGDVAHAVVARNLLQCAVGTCPMACH
jgi:hypothetical protein